MKVTEEMVLHVAKLASLALTEDEIPQYTQELSNIMGLVEQLDALQVDIPIHSARAQAEAESIPPILVGHGIEAFRADGVEQAYVREDLLANGPEVEEGFFRVPRIL